jgi:hypothetical protein
VSRDRFVPSSGTRAERRRWQREEEADRLAHERPNEPPPRHTPYTTCHDSVYLTHRFIPDGRGGRRCAFCRKPEESCLLP